MKNLARLTVASDISLILRLCFAQIVKQLSEYYNTFHMEVRLSRYSKSLFPSPPRMLSTTYANINFYRIFNMHLL